MSDNEIVKTIVGAVLTGGLSVATTSFTIFRDLKKKVQALTDVVGQNSEPKTGLFAVMGALTTQVENMQREMNKFRREVDSWDEDPPDWALRLSKTGRSSSMDLNHLLEIEEQVKKRLASFQSQMTEHESEIQAFERRIKASLNDLKSDDPISTADGFKFVTRPEHAAEMERRRVELESVQRSIRALDAGMSGVMEVLGLTDSNKKPTRLI